MKGKFITLEGPDGSGKSTNVNVLVDCLKSRGYDVIKTREPGGTELGEKIRALLLNDEMCPKAELLLFAAQRAEHIEKTIKPALFCGKIVISDRFYDSTYAYQGARGYIFDVLQLEDFVHKGFQPDYTLFFNIPFEESLKRLSIREGVGGGDRFEKEKIDYKRLVYHYYQDRFKIHSDRMVEIHAEHTADVVALQVVNWACNTFPAITE